MNRESQSLAKRVCVALPIDTEQEKGSQLRYKNLHHYLSQLLSLQLEVNQQLIVNTILTDGYMKQADETNGKASSSEGSTQTGNTQKIVSCDNQKRPLECKIIDKRKKEKKITKYRQPSSGQEYEPSQQQQIIVQYKLSQSKNVPKNYGKSILNFIKKQQNFTNRVLTEFGLNIGQFEQFLTKFKNNINTIAQLRSLWIDSAENPFSQILRIITSQYLRKHSLSHIFNSRVQNFGKHIKYRQKILKAVERPQEFTQMKDF